MIFPGQGSQSIGMLDALAARHPVIGDTLAEAGDVLGFDLATIIAEGPAQTLNQTETTQPAMLAADVAVWRAWRAAGGAEPRLLAGHSLGEYAALVVGEALSFADALAATRLRARAMARAVAGVDVAMAAIVGLDENGVARACSEAETAYAEAGRVVSPANFNAPGQVVIAGHADAVARAGECAKRAGAKLVKPLAVSVPAHCALMRAAQAELDAHLAALALQPPRIPVLHNVDAGPRESAEAMRAALIEQLSQPVRWVDTVCAMRDAGCDTLLECGPGGILSGLNKRIDKRLDSFSLGAADAFDAALAETA